MTPHDEGADPSLHQKGTDDSSSAARHGNSIDWMGNPSPSSAMTPFQTLFENVDWEKSAIGPMESWPRDLKQLVRFIMVDTSPCVIYWGNAYTVLYNESYIKLVGTKHPESLGKSAHDMFPEFWAHFATIITNQRKKRQTVAGEASMLLMDRYGFMEETYFDWKLIPIIGDDGEVKGSYGIGADMTNDTIIPRQTKCVQDLAHSLAQVSSMSDLWEVTVASLAKNEKDIPFALIYSVEPQTHTSVPLPSSTMMCHLEGFIGTNASHPIAKEYLDINQDMNGFAPGMRRALLENKIILVQASDENSLGELLKGVEWKGHGQPSHQFATVTFMANGTIAGFLVVGLNPYRKYDVDTRYQDFLPLLAQVLGPRISQIRISEEQLHRAEAAHRAALSFQKRGKRFSKFAELSVVGLAVADTDKNIIYANQAFENFFNLDPEVDSYSGWISRVHPDDVAIMEEWWARVLTEKNSGQFQFRSNQPFHQGHMSSEHKTAICACYVDLTESGEVESLMCLVIDISERKWHEEQLLERTRELEKSMQNFRNYAENCPLGIVRTDGDGFVQYGNDSWRAFYGFQNGDVIPDPEPWLPYIHDGDKKKARDFFANLKTDPGPTAVEFRIKDRTYSVQEGDKIIENDMWAMATGFSGFDKSGKVEYIDFWVMDVSAQKMAIKIITEKMEDAIRLKNQQEHFIDMISHEIRNPLSAVLHCGEEVVQSMKNCLSVLPHHIFPDTPPECRISLYDAVREHVDSALDAANTIMCCVQHQKQIVDHVLTLSKLDADLLVVSPVPVQPSAFIRSSLKIFDHELKMTEICLSIVEHESISKLRVEWTLLDPHRLLQVVINLVTNAIKFTKTSPTREITISTRAFKEPPSGDDLGVEFVPQRYPAAQPSNATGDAGNEAQEDIYLCFSVTDTGTGLDSSERALLFNRFSQASPKTHIEYGGSGLGLFISRQITEMLGGRIGMASSAGRGCTFALFVKTCKTSPPTQQLRADGIVEPILKPILQLPSTLRVSPAAAMPAAVMSIEGITTRTDTSTNVSDAKTETVIPATETSSQSSQTVLVVEDNLVNQNILCKLLRKRNFVVEAANHGKEALSLLMPHDSGPVRRFDAILCDIEMPVMNGLEFSREVRRLGRMGSLPYMPIIGVTANVRGEQVMAAIESGMDGVTTKPYRIDELIANIEKICSAIRKREKQVKLL